MRTARKHLHWYTAELSGGAAFRHVINAIESMAAQVEAVERFFARLAAAGDRLHYSTTDELTFERLGGRAERRIPDATWRTEALAA